MCNRTPGDFLRKINTLKDAFAPHHLLMHCPSIVEISTSYILQFVFPSNCPNVQSLQRSLASISNFAASTSSVKSKLSLYFLLIIKRISFWQFVHQNRYQQRAVLLRVNSQRLQSPNLCFDAVNNLSNSIDISHRTSRL